MASLNANSMLLSLEKICTVYTTCTASRKYIISEIVDKHEREIILERF